MRTTLFLTSLLGGLLLTATSASAGMVCFGGDLGPDSCTPSNESKIFLESATDTMTGNGNVGSETGLPVVDFTSTDSLDFANGFATITPSAKGGKSSFSNLDITIPGHSFTDLIFDLQMVKHEGGESFTVDAWNGATLEGGYTYTTAKDGLTHDADTNFIVQALTGSLTEVTLTSSTGFTDAKHFEVSGIPEASTWMMMLAGFAGLGFAGYRGASKTRLALDA